MEPAEVRARPRKHWDAVAGGWGTWLAWTERNFAPLTEWLCIASRLRAGASVLDVACGAGYPARALAPSVQSGYVIACDLSSQMISMAAGQAAAEGVDTIEFVQRDAEDLQFADRSFDAVVNTYGLMFCPEPRRALAEARRVLRQDGRIVLATWGMPSASPFFSVFRTVAGAFLEIRDPGPNEPGAFRLSSAAELHSMLEDAGFSSIAVERLEMTFEFDSALDYCPVFRDYGWGAQIDALSSDQQNRLSKMLTEGTRPYVYDGRLQLPTMSLCASATKSV